ncbi:MAG TPA: 5-oxoprolinase subunit PxpB [Rhodanobacteraceae bacterium]|nr:5-oxoprolinase subunit PxpB [Rhodanobacteraceae bacterium]
MADFSIETLSEDALLLRFGDGIDAPTNARVHAVARALRSADLPGIIDIAPAYATLLVRFDPLTRISKKSALPFERIASGLRSIVEAVAGQPGGCGLDPATAELQTSPPDSALSPEPPRGRGRGSIPDPAFSCRLPLPQTAPPLGGEGWGEGENAAQARPSAGSSQPTGRPIEIPVCYGDEYGPDLDAVAEQVRLARGEVIERHTAAEYTVAMLGFAPGFPYLLGLDPTLHMPRRANPRTGVPAGSVAIGGAQTGIYPRKLPGGWQLIGRTPLVLFDPERQPPCLLAPGNRVRFVAIGPDEFTRRSGGAT